jgi:hypothetical protein
MPHRFVAMLLLLLFGVACVTLPAHAGKPSAGTTATITGNGACSFTVTYTWSGLSGTGLVAEIAIGYKGPFNADIVFAWTRVPNQAGSGGSVSATFTLTGAAAPHEFFGRGNLFQTSRKSASGLTAVRNASAVSGYLASQECGLTPAVS